VDAERESSGITISLRDGRMASVKLGPLLGSPENRLSAEQLEMKFTDCVRNAVRPLPDETVHAAARAFLHVEDVQNVSELLRSFI
jgi:2-methylcitrate dehydratase PrpD